MPGTLKGHIHTHSKLVRTLAVWPWVKGIKGFAELTLAAIVGESGGPSAPDAVGSYRGPQALWKRINPPSADYIETDVIKD